MVWGARFTPAFEPDEQGAMVLDLEKLSEITPAEIPSAASALKLEGEKGPAASATGGLQTG